MEGAGACFDLVNKTLAECSDDSYSNRLYWIYSTSMLSMPLFEGLLRVLMDSFCMEITLLGCPSLEFSLLNGLIIQLSSIS